MTAASRHAIRLAVAGLVVAAAFSAPAKEIGESHSVLAQAGQGPPKVIVFRENEVRGKTVAADANGLLQLLFSDGTTLTLGPNSTLTIDSFIFDPAGARAKLVATLTRGVFRFIGGRTSKTPEGVSLATPFGTVAIQSAGADLSLGAGDRPAHFDLVYGGSMTLAKGSTELAQVRKPGYSIVPDPSGRSAVVRKTPPEWRSDLQGLLSSRVVAPHFAARSGAIGPAEDQW